MEFPSGAEVKMESTVEDTATVASTIKAVFGKEVKFEAARKQYNGFVKTAGFRVETLNPDAGRKRAAAAQLDTWQKEGKRKVDGSDFWENGLDPELTFGIPVRKIGAGLQNLGNTCFLNSVLQCLTYTEPLAAYLQSGKHKNSCHIAGFCALCAIQKHVSRALQSTGRSLVPKDLVANLRCISRNFRNARQEDAHEYMVNLLESMHKCCLPSGVASESPAAYEKSLVHKIFGGHLCSRVQCQKCSHYSDKLDPFLDLSLEIVKADTLLIALRNFTAPEMLDGGERHYQCQRCKDKVRAKKQLTVYKAPYVLTIHLKRFHAHDPTRKVDKKVLFDRSLDLKPFVTESYEGELKYSLYGVLVHFGYSTHSGHYVCFVRTSSGMWYLLNDNEVRQVSEKTVLEQKAYMLFYVRDRKHIIPKKHVDVVCKENMNTAVSANFGILAFKQFSKEHADNGSIENRSHTANAASSTVVQKGALIVSTSKETGQENSSFGQNKGVVMPKAELSLNDPLTKVPSKGVCSLNPDEGERLPPSVVSTSCDSPKVENDTIINGLITRVSKEVPSAHELSSNETSQKIDHVSNEGVVSEILSEDSDGRTLENASGQAVSLKSTATMSNRIDPEQKPNEPGCESSQAGGILNANASGSLPSDQAGDSCQERVDVSVGSTVLAVPDDCLQEKVPDCMPRRKMQRKLLRCRVPYMYLGLKVFKVSFGLRKKKYKKGKRRTLDTQNLIKGNLLEISELGPSTSVNCTATTMRPTRLRRKVAKSCSKLDDGRKKCSDDSMMKIADGELREKINHKDADFSTYEKFQKSSYSFSVANQQDCREYNLAENSKSDSSHGGIVSMLTQGIEETTVARWDGVEISSSPVLDSKKTSVGYVPDEWDEEYDRGRRKKLRHSKHQFGGPNLFQEFVSNKTQFQKPKMDRSSSGNRPFRI